MGVLSNHFFGGDVDGQIGLQLLRTAQPGGLAVALQAQGWWHGSPDG